MAHMDVLLCEDIDNLGQRGQVVRVRAGYGRNYLLPQKLAIKATSGNKRMIDDQRRVLAKREDSERVSAQSEAEKLQGLELRFERRVGEHGILFGSVTALDIAEALKERGLTVERRRIGLREHIKEVGDYDVTIKLHRDVSPSVKVLVRKEGAAEEAKAPEAEAAAEVAPEADSTASDSSEQPVVETSADAPEASDSYVEGAAE
ncbi:MAG TPA: 50S ribosomal protein L9 [Blastocatellia bacterium]|nr:50S ribosomal protein L9 [Blastocatellia bacterium]